MAMQCDEKLVIGYAGSLSGYKQPVKQKNNKVIKKINEYLWTYKVDNIDFFTRSGYYLFKGIKRLKDEYPAEAKKLSVQLWGMIDNLNKKQVKEFGIEEIVSIDGYFNKDASLKKTEQCDVVFLPLESSKSGQRPLFLPGKLFEYLHQSKPILVLAGNSDCAEIIEKSGLGIICEPCDEEGIVQKLLFLIKNKSKLNDLYKPNIEYIESNFNFKTLTRKLAGVFDQL